jgi:hypothetical protein
LTFDQHFRPSIIVLNAPSKAPSQVGILTSAEIFRQAHLQLYFAVYALAAVIFLVLVVSFWFRTRNAGSRLQSDE